MPMKTKVAAVQVFSDLADPDTNLERVLCLAREAASNGAKLIAFPECMNAGYVWQDPDHAISCADPIPGRFTEALGKVAAEFDAYIAIGLSEFGNSEEGEGEERRNVPAVYNAVALIGPEGLVGKYEKNFLFDFDPYWFARGKTGYPVFETPIGNIGLFVCADARIPEGARTLALNGAELLLHITNSTTHEQHEIHVPTRGSENEVLMISADKAGREKGLTYPGNTLIISPDGAVQGQASFTEEEIVYGEFDREALREVRARHTGILRGRRPETYGVLAKPYEDLPCAKLAETPVVPGRLAVLASALQVTNTDGDARTTLARAVEVGDEAAKENARLIVFPELFLCPPAMSRDEAEAAAELTEETLSAFAAPARKWEANYVLSLVERDGGRLYHTAFVLGADGGIAGRYRKVHLCEAEARWASAGDDYTTVEMPFGNVGVMLGHEVRYFEVARILTCLGADVIAVPSAFQEEREERLFLRERALENKVFVVAANRLDAPVPGRSKVLLPNAAVAAEAKQGQKDYTFNYMNLVWARDKQIRPGTDLIRNRRPELYQPICMPWHG